MPRVSVLLTCYNHIRYLPPAMDALRSQTFADFEVIALDDGSSDGTREWLAQQSDPWLKTVFNEKNLGTYGTLNAGLELAQGEFVAVLNDDDLWAPEKLERQVAMMDARPEIGLVHTDGVFIDGEGKEFEGEPLGFAFPKTETGDLLLTLVYSNKIIASAVLARAECFRQLGGFNQEYFGSGDWEMWYRIAEKWQVGFVAERLTAYRVHGANASHKLDKIWQDDEKLRTWISGRLSALEGRFSPDEARLAEAHNWACLGTVRTLNGNPAGGRDAYRRSLALNPTRWQSRLRSALTYLPRPLFRRLVPL